jgi:hypothetical protein
MPKKKQIKIHLGEEMKVIDDELDSALGRLEVANESVREVLTPIGEAENPAPEGDPDANSPPTAPPSSPSSVEMTCGKPSQDRVPRRKPNTAADSA